MRPALSNKLHPCNVSLEFTFICFLFYSLLRKGSWAHFAYFELITRSLNLLAGCLIRSYPAHLRAKRASLLTLPKTVLIRVIRVIR